MKTNATSLLVVLGLTFAVSAHADRIDAPRWPDTKLGRLETFALIEQLNGELLASRSATTTLENWCGKHHMASPARVIAIQERGAAREATAEDRAALDVSPTEPLRYRHVSLSCGGHVLSDAENWYVPSRLTPDMNHALDTTETPFGRVIAPLKPTRQTLSVERLWSPLPEDWENGAAANPGDNNPSHDVPERLLTIPPDVFRDRAVVLDGSQRPVALVMETYKKGVLEFSH
jgi:hypothetical protein